jgi:endoglucanase
MNIHVTHCLSFATIGLASLLIGHPPQEPREIIRLDRPFLFSYLSWENKVKVEGGRAVLRATPRGGAGMNIQPPIDLSADTNLVPTLQVNVGSNNKANRIKLMLVDDAERSGAWTFALPKSGTAWITPISGGPLSEPEELGKDATGKSKGKPNLKSLIQFQLLGDWSSDDALEVDVLKIGVRMPDAAATAAREKAQQAQAEVARQAEAARAELRTKYGTVSAQSPRFLSYSFLGPQLVCLEIESGKVSDAGLAKYVPQAGDEVQKDGPKVFLVRGGNRIGYLIGPKRDWLANIEKFEGDPLIEEYAADLNQYTLEGSGGTIRPVEVHRKSRPVNAAMPSYEMVLRHRVYLKLPSALSQGSEYTLNWGKVNVQGGPQKIRYAPDETRSQAVHVNQIGFRPSDPVKRAFLSEWLGTGGVHNFGDAPKFRVIEAVTGATVASGTAKFTKKANEKELIQNKQVNYSLTDVYRMDFPQVTKPGTYKVVVDGVGTSDPFPIAENVWQKAFRTQIRGLYHNRSGMELGPPYTTYRKPRDMHPADGQLVYQSTHSVLDGNEAFEKLEKTSTGKLVPEAWGGYHDAGDWNPRRVTHLKVTMAQMELFELFPTFGAAQSLNIPKPTKAPDILNEALWELDCFRRLQLPHGGVRFGIETNGDPIEGEVSWLQSMPAYVYAADPYSSWVYAAAAIRYSDLVKPYDAALSKTYRESALKAMTWAEANLAPVRSKIAWEMWDARNLAALLVYRSTKDDKWHKVFLENSVLTKPEPKLFAYGTAVQTDSAFVYARLPQGLGKAELKLRAKAALEAEAQTALKYAESNGWNLTTNDVGKPAFLGFYSSPNAIEVARAHYLTGNPEYLAGTVQACLFSGGANPNNLTYTSGLGVRSARPFKIDYRIPGQAIPEGITIYGNCDYAGWPDNGFFTWPIQWHVSRVGVPSPYNWPIHEALFETYLYPATEEYTVDNWAPNVFVWGYLAARK